MGTNTLPCLESGEEASMYIGANEKPDGNFTFEAVLGEDGYYHTFPDNPVCNTCKYALDCVTRLMEDLCTIRGNEILEVYRTQ